MRCNLPPLDQELLQRIFDSVYIGCPPTSDPRIQGLVDTLYAMLQFNFHFRPEDTGGLYDLYDAYFNFGSFPGGARIWLALILAVQELYGLSDSVMVELMQTVTLKEKPLDGVLRAAGDAGSDAA